MIWKDKLLSITVLNKYRLGLKLRVLIPRNLYNFDYKLKYCCMLIISIH